MDWAKETRITVTGGAGFLGKFVVEKLAHSGYKHIFVPLSKDYNLIDLEAVKKLYRDSQPDVVIHLAGIVGGIGLNRAYPGQLFYDNLIMGVQMMEQGRLFGVKKFVAIGSICGYPDATPLPFQEDNFWDGYPPEDVAPYGLAKKMLLVQSQAYRKQYGFNSIFLAPANLYGPGDNFNLQYSHVIPALIRKVDEAKQSGKDKVIVWGTGAPTRDLLYVEDCAEGIVLATERYGKSEPVNLGKGVETSIKDIILLICELMGFEGDIEFDISKPNGQMRRRIDTQRAEREFGFKAKTDIREGLRRTIEWYQKNRTLLAKS